MKSFDILDPKTPVEGHHFLQASAGTGKTFAIEHVTIRLLLKNIPLERILLVTFTRAATRELKARLQKAIYKALYNPDAPYIHALKGCPSARFALEKALALINDAQIFTIHGFCLRMLKEYAFEAELDFNLLGEKEEPLHADHLKEEITHFFRTGLKQEDVSASQLSAILKNNPKGLIKHLSTLIEKEGSIPYFPPFKQSYLSFKEALLSLPKFSLEDFYKILPFFNKMSPPSFSEQIKILENPITEEMFDHFLSFPKNVFSFLKKENVKKRKKEPLPKETDLFLTLSEVLLPIIETAKNPLHTLCRIARSCQDSRNSQERFNRGLLPGDILKEMQKSIERPAFLDQVRGRFDAAIIDEFQDTDPLQWSIFKRLFVKKPISTLFLVGDPKQSIYSFRNSDIYSYLNAGKEVEHHAYLGTNYRSDPHLTALLNALFSKNPHFLSLPDAPLPYRAVSSPKIATKASIKDDKSPVHFFICEKEKGREKSWPTKEMEETIFFPFIAKEVLHLKKEGVPLEEIAILVKDRFQAAHLIETLLSYGISTVTKGGGDLTKTSSFMLCLFFLEAVARPANTGSIKRFYSHPLLPFTHHDLKKEIFIAEGIALFTELSRVFKKEGLENMFAKAFSLSFKKDSTLEALILNGGGLEAFSDFQKVLALALDFRAQIKTPSLKPLIEHFYMLKHEGGDSSGLKRHVLNDKEGVSVMTIHMSKGLEFSFVFALGLIKRQTAVDPLLYHKQEWVCSSLDERLYKTALKSATGEKLRQLYVALTRAKKRVYVPALISKELDVLKPEASPIEIFLKELLPLKESLDEMGISTTYLNEEVFSPHLHREAVVLKEPLSVFKQFVSQKLSSFSSLATSTQSLLHVGQGELLPPGRETGQMLHSLIEKVIIEGTSSPYDKEGVKRIISSYLSKSSFQPFEKEITECIEGAFHTSLEGTFLKDVDQDKLFTEVEFHYLEEEGNMIKGVIDLIFEVNNKFYIVDWKSNALPDYQKSTLIEAMKSHDYFLQADLYANFLKRYLKQKKAHAQFGGTFYVFLRGLKEEQGVLFLP